MVDNTESVTSNTAPMPGLLTGEGLNLVLSGSSQIHHQGMKLEAVMEHLQRQQQARLEMEGRERKDRGIREAHIFYAQQFAAQQAALAASSRSPPGTLGSRPLPAGPSLPRVTNKNSMDSDPEDDAFEGEDPGSDLEDEEMARGGHEEDEDDDDEEDEEEYLRKQAAPAVPPPRLPPAHRPSVSGQSQQPGSTQSISPSQAHSKSPTSHHEWGYEEQFKQMQPSDWMANDQSESGGKNSFRTANVTVPHIPGTIKQNGSLAWNEDADGGRAREAAKDFAKLYELDSDPKRKEFLDDLFVFMQKRGTPVNRIPIMAKQVLDLYMLYKLVTEKGGLVEVINKKIWREITKGLNLPTSITSAAFTLRTQYMKYLYPYECEKQSLSSPAELQAAIDSNRREGRRPSYSSALFGYSPSSASSLLSPPKVHLSSINVPASNGTHLSPGQVIKKEDTTAACSLTPSRIHIPLALGGHHSAAQAITLEQLREKLESGEPPEKKLARYSEDQQRLMQQALQQNLFAMATHVPMSIKINGKDERQELALNLSTNGISSINMSIEINGTLYTGVLFAQRPTVHVIAGPSISTPASQSTTSPTSVKGPASAEPSTSSSP
ncbi:AT-rich interactive domain-containing protein 3B-like isoform X2 [Pristis pectinata]|uniref:AT-rich interactive domain-containing protein 3B-like isoform X2 n=1 Tax=Pristis pectinata TaxID=685728 RepID=UPI00223E11F3|nr:AT-rich interactive domain-containing protein 3B-like isoform X2 [Pristis pectinata]